VTLYRSWLLAVELDDARERKAQRSADVPPSEPHAFCGEHRSWFCPCVAPWLYEGGPVLTPTGFWGREYVARAWDDPRLAKSIWQRRREIEDDSGQAALL